MRESDLIGLVGGLLCFIVVFVLSISLVASFLAAIARTLRRVSPENRRMEPSQVYLNLIPVFNLLWVVVTVERVAESLRNEFQARDLHSRREWYGRGYGLTAAVCLLPSVWFYPFILSGPVAAVCGFLYWRAMNRYAARLKPGTYAPPPTDEGW